MAVFGDMLISSQKTFDSFHARGHLKDLDVF